VIIEFSSLNKPYLLRFKGSDILSYVMLVASIFSLIAAMTYHRNLDFGLIPVILMFILFGLCVAAITYAPLRLLYRFIQRIPLYAGIILTVLITASIAYFTLLWVAGHLSYSALSDYWPPAIPTQLAIQVTVITVLGYLMVIQIAVASRRERMARRKNITNRMKALQARIRPHFFFNTLNSVASLIRSDPERAEKAIEDLADIFRVVIRQDKKVVSLASDIEIAKQYLNIEKLRLGDRLTVEWHTTEDAMNATIPGLTLQPLLENAVYHGIEPNLAGGKITIDCTCEDERLLILITNPVPEIKSTRQGGNQIALKNIKERLKRQFGGDVKINIRETVDRFNISIDAPLVKAQSES
jgi:two-component system sensor histidine kinase AlgZ